MAAVPDPEGSGLEEGAGLPPISSPPTACLHIVERERDPYAAGLLKV